MTDTRTNNARNIANAHASARAHNKTKALEATAAAQRNMLIHWLRFFEVYCTDAITGKLAQDTREALR